MFMIVGMVVGMIMAVVMIVRMVMGMAVGMIMAVVMVMLGFEILLEFALFLRAAAAVLAHVGLLFS